MAGKRTENIFLVMMGWTVEMEAFGSPFVIVSAELFLSN